MGGHFRMSGHGQGSLAGRQQIPLLARWPVVVLLIICAAAWLPGLFSLPPLDRDESRFAEASKQMIESGDYVNIRFTTVPRYNKPIGVYWLQAGATRLFGRPPYNQIWTYRIPSFLGALFAVLLTYWLARALAPPPAALISAILLAVLLLLAAEAKIAKTDALLLATVVAAQAVFLRVYLCARDQVARPSKWVTAGGWVAIGAGILLKGPVILFVLALTILAVSLWDRDWRWLRALRPGYGLLIVAAIVLPWALAIQFASHGAFYEKSLGHDFAAKVLGGQETHGAPPGYYLALSTLTLWPATLVALPALGWGMSRRSEPSMRYLLAWLIPNWLLFELVPTKLPHYILPVYPAVAVLAGLWATRVAEHVQSAPQRILRIVSVVQFAIGTVLLAAATFLLLHRFGGAVPWWIILGLALVLLLAAASALLILFGKTETAIAGASLASILLCPILGAGIAPGLHQIWMSPQIAKKVAADRRAHDPPVVLAGYVEPSLVFLLGSKTRIETGAGAGGIAAQQGGLVLIEDHERSKFLEALGSLGGAATPVDQISGFNYSRGRHEHITFYRVTAAPRITVPPPE
jgi:4-amino-4-deoxy-L-arabinose transferase-like glycosyltransferase